MANSPKCIFIVSWDDGHPHGCVCVCVCMGMHVCAFVKICDWQSCMLRCNEFALFLLVGFFGCECCLNVSICLTDVVKYSYRVVT